MDDLIDAMKGPAIIEKKKRLYEIYGRFEEDASEYKRDAVCRKGCSFCCTFMGNVDITTLEAVIIRERLALFSPHEQSMLSSKIKANRMERKKGRKSPCPFLDEQGLCGIYDVRPFSCRQLYSLRKCEDTGATIHRRAYELSRKAILSVQQLDHTGYSGNLSFILHLLDDTGFREFYLSGGFDPGRIRDFGRSHGIVINRRIQGT
ncbi:MAG: YkgJ family cysteine cluster protein [Candidatus Sulfobium sp.]|jgi:hypothetical protein